MTELEFLDDFKRYVSKRRKQEDTKTLKRVNDMIDSIIKANQNDLEAEKEQNED